jgi:hypothetical protein
MNTRIRTAFSFLLFLALVASVSATVAQGPEPAGEGIQQAPQPQAVVQDALNLELVGQLAGPARSVAVQGSYAYVISTDAELPGLRIIDVSDPTAPSQVGFCDLPGGARDVAVEGSYAYVATWDSGLRIIDVSAPANPSETGSYDTPGYAVEVALAGNYAYVADGPSGLRIIDVSIPAAPSEEGFYEVVTGRVAVMGSYAYVVDGGLRIIDVSNPTAPSEAGFYGDDYAEDVAVAGNYAYVASGFDGLHIIDVSTPAEPTETGACSTYPGYAYNVVVAGSYAFVPYAFLEGGFALGIIDVSDPSAPFEAGFYELDNAAHVAVAGNYIYVAAGDGGLLILRFAPPLIVVPIDIKPDSNRNSIMCDNEKAIIAVAILTDPDFDATTVDHTTVTFEGASETHVRKGSGEPVRREVDVDGDGDIDLLFQFRLGDTTLTCESTEGTLRGQTFDGQAIQGTDAVRMINPGPFVSPLLYDGK